MRKYRHYSISAMLLMAAGLSSVAYADGQGSISELEGNCLGSTISPNGKYVVGSNPSQNLLGINMSAFVYHTDTGEIEWPLMGDESDITKGGEFTGVNNNGVIIGTVKDPNFIITDLYGNLANANIATVFVDGKATHLGYGAQDPTQFSDQSDGSFGRAISEDGKTAVGFVSRANQAYHYPTVWRQGEDGTWTGETLPLPEGANGGEALAISCDGKVISGNMWRFGNHRPCYWVDGECIIIERDESDWRPEWSGMSSNGRFISYQCSSKLYIYDSQDKSIRELPQNKDTYYVDGVYASLADNGNMVASYKDSNGTYPFYYSYADNQLYDFKTYAELNAPDAKPNIDLGTSTPRDITADGMTIMGNAIGYGSSTCYVLYTVDTDAVIAEAPAAPELISIGLNEVTVSWPEYSKTYDGLTLTGYNIYKNGTLVASPMVSDPRTITFKDVPAGYPVYSMSAMFSKAIGGETESQISLENEIAVAENYNLPLYEEFEGSYAGNYWSENIMVGNTISQRWGCFKYEGIESTFSLSNGLSTENQPYDTALESRPLDATKADQVSINFVSHYDFVNSRDWDLSKELTSIEVSTDFGKTWQEVVSYPVSEQSFGWRMYDVDLSKYVAGKVFRVRLRNHGPATGLFRNYFDNLKISTTPEREAPTDLAGYTYNNGDLALMWHSTLDTYQLNYLYNYPYLMGMGDEGNDFIAVNSFEPEDLAPYAGKYLTSVSALINHYAELEKVTRANAVIYIDNQLVAEQEIKDIVPNRENSVILDDPILIDGTKEIKVGIKIYDYDPADLPITYQNAIKAQYMKSDLYSQDGGKTWLSLYDFYKDTETPDDGYAIWYISANFTDEAVTGDAPVLEDPEIFCYNIFKNGNLLNSLIIDPAAVHYLDSTPDMNAAYTVKAYYKNGDISKISESMVPALNSIKTVDNGNSFSYSRLNGSISAEGNISLYTIDGVKVAGGNSRVNVSDMTNGIYILVIDNNGNRTNHKVRISK